MKSVFVVYNQALSEQVLEAVKRVGVRGYTQWQGIFGTGSQGGEPHMGSHTWPSVNMAMLIMTTDELCVELKLALRAVDAQSPQQGLRVFSWTVDEE
jgi:hypothetical protein